MGEQNRRRTPVPLVGDAVRLRVLPPGTDRGHSVPTPEPRLRLRLASSGEVTASATDARRHDAPGAAEGQRTKHARPTPHNPRAGSGARRATAPLCVPESSGLAAVSDTLITAPTDAARTGDGHP